MNECLLWSRFSDLSHVFSLISSFNPQKAAGTLCGSNKPVAFPGNTVKIWMQKHPAQPPQSVWTYTRSRASASLSPLLHNYEMKQVGFNLIRTGGQRERERNNFTQLISARGRRQGAVFVSKQKEKRKEGRCDVLTTRHHVGMNLFTVQGKSTPCKVIILQELGY